jgi:hypothetical protein
LGYKAIESPHSNNPYDYVEVALKKTKFMKLLDVFSVYYFCLKANLCDDFDKRFQPFMSGSLKDDSATELESMSILTTDSRRTKVDVLNDDEFMVTMKKIVVSQHTMSQSQSSLEAAQKRMT